MFKEMILSLNQLSSDTENGRRDANDMKNKALELKKKAEVSKLSLEDAEKKLRLSLEEAAAAKAAEASAFDHIKDLSEMTSAAICTTSESYAKVTISTEEFELLSHKGEESNKLADMKVAAVMAQVEAVKASENEALKRLEATQKEITDMKTTTQETLKGLRWLKQLRWQWKVNFVGGANVSRRKLQKLHLEYLKHRCHQDHLHRITGLKCKTHLQ